MKAYIEFPDVSEERIEVQQDLWVITHDRNVELIMEAWESKSNVGVKE